MKIPKNMTYDQVMKQIEVVINRIAPKYTFNTYDVDDIKQEAFIICMDALDRYDQKRPLENFLSVHLSNRLKNFVRDNFYTKDEEDKKKVLKPQYITNEHNITYVNDYDINVDAKSLSELINKYLPSSYRADYLKMINNVYIPKKRRDDIITLIKELVEAHSNEEGAN